MSKCKGSESITIGNPAVRNELVKDTGLASGNSK